MLPKWHIILGFIFTVICFWLFPEIGFVGFLIIFLSSFLIDTDHYLFHVFTKKDLSLKNAHQWFIEDHNKFQKLNRKERKVYLKKLLPRPMIFHGIEAILILIILSFISPLFSYILIGFLFHEFLDLIYIIYGNYTLTHIGSQTYNIMLYFKKK